MNNEKYLPIGSVVMLKGGEKRIMVIGYLGQDTNNKENKVYDYIGCLYPEGLISAEKILLFNHLNIDKIYFLGYSDEEDKRFKEKLKSLI